MGAGDGDGDAEDWPTLGDTLFDRLRSWGRSLRAVCMISVDENGCRIVQLSYFVSCAFLLHVTRLGGILFQFSRSFCEPCRIGLIGGCMNRETGI